MALGGLQQLTALLLCLPNDGSRAGYDHTLT